MDLIKNLINAIANDNTIDSMKYFESAVHEKVAAAIQDKKEQVGASLFGEAINLDEESTKTEELSTDRVKVAKPTGSLNQGLKHNVTYKGRTIGHVTQWHDGDGGTVWSARHTHTNTYISNDYMNKEQTVEQLAKVHAKYLNSKESLEESIELEESNYYHSVWVKSKGDDEWSHHFDADSKEDAASEKYSCKNNGEKCKVIKVHKDLANWTNPEHRKAALAKLNEEAEELDEAQEHGPVDFNTKVRVGHKVAVLHGSGLDSGKSGTVIGSSNSRVGPQWKIKTDNGDVIEMHKHRVAKLKEETEEAEELDEGKYVGGPVHTWPVYIGQKHSDVSKNIRHSLVDSGHSFTDHSHVNKDPHHYISMNTEAGHKELLKLKHGYNLTTYPPGSPGYEEETKSKITESKELTELSKKTLADYVKKASKDQISQQEKRAEYKSEAKRHGIRRNREAEYAYKDAYDEKTRIANNRVIGISQAVDKLTESATHKSLSDYQDKEHEYLESQGVDNHKEIYDKVKKHFGDGEVEVHRGGISSKEPGYDDERKKFKPEGDRLKLNVSPFKDPRHYQLGSHDGKPAVIYGNFTSEYLITHKKNK